MNILLYSFAESWYNSETDLIWILNGENFIMSTFNVWDGTFEDQESFQDCNAGGSNKVVTMQDMVYKKFLKIHPNHACEKNECLRFFAININSHPNKNFLSFFVLFINQWHRKQDYFI